MSSNFKILAIMSWVYKEYFWMQMELQWYGNVLLFVISLWSSYNVAKLIIFSQQQLYLSHSINYYVKLKLPLNSFYLSLPSYPLSTFKLQIFSFVKFLYPMLIWRLSFGTRLLMKHFHLTFHIHLMHWSAFSENH